MHKALITILSVIMIPFGLHADIQIATQKYNNTQFSSIKTRVNTVTNTLSTIVGETLTQASTISELHTNKQTSPEQGCPSGKKCLLIKNANGANQWFEIIEDCDDCDSGASNLPSGAKFTITTTNMSANSTFKFDLSAKGTFTVNCGDSGTLSGTGVSGNTITKGDTSGYTYTCTYSTGGATKTITFDGTATGYSTGTDRSDAAISFSTSSSKLSGDKIASISGSLGALFPTLGQGSGQQPIFHYTFYGASNMTSIPAGLFSGVTGSAQYMFYQTFNNCTSLTSIPAELFSGVTGSAEKMFSGTFAGCTGLTSIPSELFSGVTGSAQQMFDSTFYMCSSLTSIPAGLFSGVTDSAQFMFYQTFYNCTNLSGYIHPSIFAGLIANNSPYTANLMTYVFKDSGLSTSCPTGTTQFITGYESYWDSKVACVPNSELTTYTITYELDGGTNYSGAPTSYQAVPGLGAPSVTTISGAPTKDGYAFAGWCTDSNLTNCAFRQTISKSDTGDKTFYANWTASTSTSLPTLLRFTFDGCGPCRIAYNMYYTDADIETDYAGRLNVMTVNQSTTEGAALATQYNISTYPTQMLVDENGEQIGKALVGGVPKASVQSWLDSNL